MDIGSILLIIALLLLVILFISRPFFERERPSVENQTKKDDHDLSALLAERDRILTALQELDFDYTLGKVPAEGYPAQRAALVQQGVDVLRKLDEIQVITPEEQADDQLEAAIARRRADLDMAALATALNGGSRPLAGVTTADDDLEILLAQRRRQRQEKAAGFCPQCGGAVQKSDRFCPKCGATLI